MYKKIDIKGKMPLIGRMASSSNFQVCKKISHIAGYVEFDVTEMQISILWLALGFVLVRGRVKVGVKVRVGIWF